jgi:hypothetical protein
VTTRTHIDIRGIYGGIPTELLVQGHTLSDYGVNAIWMGSSSLSAEGIALLKDQRAQVFAEFNSMHEAGYLAERPDAAPVGAEGTICPPPDGWQGLCPTHPGYRRNRMEAFRVALQNYEIDGIWLDYHHSHASWEQAVPNMPDTCFCDRCLARFALESGLRLPEASVADLSRLLLCELHREWVAWRCGVFTDWVREYRDIINAVRPTALLGTFHCPWSDADHDGALRQKLAIDLSAQAAYIDVFSIMPYHARFAHADDPVWISRQIAWLGEYLDIQGLPAERPRIWPIVQLSDWGETVPVEQVSEVLKHGTCSPATGVMVFAWGALRHQPDKIDALGRYYRSIAPENLSPPKEQQL